VFHPAGPVLAGRGEGATSLSRVREIRELEAQLIAARENTAQAESQVSSTELSLLECQRMIEENTKQAAGRREAEQAAARRAEETRQAKAAKEEELRWQEARRAELETERQEIAADAARLAGETAELGARLETARAELGTAERGGKGAPEGEAVYDLPHWQTSFALAEQAEREIGARTADAEESLARGNRSVAERQDRVRALEGEQTQLEASLHSLRGEESRLSASIHETQTQIEPAEKQLAEAEKEQADLEGEEAESRMRLHSAENQYTQAQVDLARRQEELEGLRRRIEDDFGLVEFEYASEVTGPNPLPLSELVEHLPYVEAVTPEIEEVVNRRRSQLRRMGAINPEAVREFAEVKERYEFLSGQVKDLQQAETQLREVIAELDTMMRDAFQKTFQAVSEEFPRIFVRLFGGGSARLVLTEADDSGDSGIDITARLPGRRSQGLALLSGGERSLTAVALVFALLKVSPTPFCVLDEVDAMLDESNVGRFRDLLAELSRQTQFVVVTHNRNTVQAAQVIYGISMGSDSASQVISLKLDEFVGK
jgi:chromosome segregation protein